MASAAAAKKWPRPFQCWAGVGADEPEVRLVDQGGGLEGLARLLGGQPGGGELAQLVVDEREQVGGGLRVAGRGGVEEAGDVGHAAEHTPPRTRRNRFPGRRPLDPAYFAPSYSHRTGSERNRDDSRFVFGSET